MDGIEVVDESVEQFFEQLEKENNIYLTDDVDITDSRDLIDQARQKDD